MSCPSKETRNFIVENVKKIDIMQKEIVTGCDSSCVSCETSLITKAYNTVPVSFSTCNATQFKALTDVGGVETPYFRIESIRDNRFVTLRLLSYDSSQQLLSCTNQTCIFDLDCCCSIQCFEPINCPCCC